MEGISPTCLPNQEASVAFFPTPDKQEKKTLPKVPQHVQLPKDPEIMPVIVRFENGQRTLQSVIYCYET